MRNIKNNPFTIASKKLKYPERNLTKEGKDLYTKTMTLMKTFEDTNK